MSDSFVFYRSFYDCINALPKENKIKVLNAIIEYGLNQTVDESDPITKAILISIIPSIDSSKKRYEQAVINGTKGKEYGSLGGRPKKTDIEKISVLKEKGYTPQKISEELKIPLKTVYANLK